MQSQIEHKQEQNSVLNSALIECLSNIPIKQKLFFSHGILVVCLIMALVVSFLSISQMQTSQENLFNVDKSTSLDLVTYRNYANQMRIGLLTIMLEDNLQIRRKMLAEIQVATKESKKISERLVKRFSKEDKANLAKMQELDLVMEQFCSTRDNELLPLIVARNLDQARKLVVGVQQKRFERMRELAKELGNNALDNAAFHMEQAAREADFCTWIFMGIALFAFAIVGVVLYALNGSITSPLQEITDSVRLVADGKLAAVSLSPVTRKDEIGVLTNAFATMASSLQELASVASQMAPDEFCKLNEANGENDLLGNAFRGMRKRQELILEAAYDPFIQFDEERQITYWNNEAQRKFGWSRREALGRSILESIVPPACQAEFVKQVQDAFNLSEHDPCENRPVEITLQNRQGDEFPVELTIFPVHEGGIVRHCAFIHDVTERKEAEKRVSEFYSIVSHELRSPLTSIRGVLGLIENGTVELDSSEGMELVQVARGSTDRLIRLINDMLDLKKIESGKMELHKRKLDISELVNTTLNSLTGAAQEADVNLLDCSKSAYIYADWDKCTQILTNLVSNAIKFSPVGNEVSILTQTNAKSVRISVCDKGTGIPKDELGKLFAKFQQLDSTDSRQKGGTGLGLAICKALVQEHDGSIGVDSIFGEGSVFWFEIPIYSESDSQINCHGQLSVNSGIVDSGNAMASILLVEDDRELATVLSACIRKDGYRVRHAACLEEAIQSIGELIPDVILLDIKLPDGSGLDLLEALRSSAKTLDVPVIVITGQQEPDGVVAGNAAIVDWLTKPLDIKQLTQTIKRAIKIPGSCKVLVVDDDSDTRKVIMAQLRAMGMKCIEAKDGHEAIYLTRAESPDIIVLDVLIPNVDGFKVVEVLRKESCLTPLLVYSGKDLDPNERRLLTLGITRHLTKGGVWEQDLPIVIAELLADLSTKQKGELTAVA